MNLRRGVIHRGVEKFLILLVDKKCFSTSLYIVDKYILICREQKMNTFDLQFLADALLAIVGPNPGSPFSYDTLASYKPQMGPHKMHEFVRISSSRRPNDEMWELECIEIYQRAELTKNQAEVLEMRLLGLSFDQIGHIKSSSRQGAMQVFLQAIKKIGRVMRVYPYVGLSDVYRSEIRRGR